jgi:adenylylsulfate kinase-like enzyme
VSCPLDVLVERDTKGLYARALKGEIQNLTGVSDPYEPPTDPDVVVDTACQTVVESLAVIVKELERRALIRPIGASFEDTSRRS